jgi:hypothetical protein
MSFKRVALVVGILCCCASVFGEITLKKNFFTGWKFSTDGTTYQKVGFSGTKLHDAMAGNEEAQKRMRSYKSGKTWAAITGWPGGFLLGWPAGASLAGKDWNDTYTTMVIIGAPLTIASIIFEATATSNLKKAVKIYNEGDKSVTFMLDYKVLSESQSGVLLAGLKYEF